MAEHFVSLKLRQPTDFLILEAYEPGENLTAPSIAYRIEHELDTDHNVSKSNINTRLPELEGYGLLEKIPPADSSGLYNITEEGEIARENRGEYGKPDVDFLELILREKRRIGDSNGT